MNVFDRAVEVLRRDGWTQNVATNEKGEHCLYGALVLASEHDLGTLWWDNLEKFTDRVASELFPDRVTYKSTPKHFCRDHSAGASVNNHWLTTQEDVELILKHASYEWELLHG